MEREVFLIRSDAVVWHGFVGSGKGGEACSARERFEEAWRRALEDGAVSQADAGQVQFRSSVPDIKYRRKVALR